MQVTSSVTLKKNPIIQEGIKQLMEFNIELNREYDFHRNECMFQMKTPFHDREYFYVRGRSSSNSIKYQCKNCKKITNVLPDNIDYITYNQQQRSYLYDMLEMIIDNKSMNEICLNLKISNKTYYHKLGLISNQLVQFQNKIEDRFYNSKYISNIYIYTNEYEDLICDKKCSMVVTCNYITGYIYRSDIKIGEDTDDFYMNTSIPHYFLLSQNKNIESWFFLTPNLRLYMDLKSNPPINEFADSLLDEKDHQLNSYVDYIKQNVKRLNSPYAQYYINIYKIIYNFYNKSCNKDNKMITPAQMTNLTDKSYILKELLAD